MKSFEDLVATKIQNNVHLYYTARDLISQMAQLLFTSGEFPHFAATHGNNVYEEELEKATNSASYTAVGNVDTMTLTLQNNHAYSISYNKLTKYFTIHVWADNRETASLVVEELRNKIFNPVIEDTDVKMGFWRSTGNGYYRTPQAITAPSWEEVSNNYSNLPKNLLDKLMNVELRGDGFGKLLLLHGPPGTGKTTLIRALSQEWKTWCSTEFILDPEQFFRDPNYILEVILEDDDFNEVVVGAPADDKWKLLILEDCDELINGDAKARTGQALSRLLNLTDGILGQGKKVLVAITTNEDIGTLHPAVTRPGRCLAQIEIGKLTYEESVSWLNDSTLNSKINSNGMTLAELYALKFNSKPQSSGQDFVSSSTGMYL